MTKKNKKSISDYITIIPKIRDGKPLIKGTIIPVEFILNQISLGWSLKEIKERYPEINYSYLVKIVDYISESFNSTYEQEEAHDTWHCNYGRYRGTTL